MRLLCLAKNLAAENVSQTINSHGWKETALQSGDAGIAGSSLHFYFRCFNIVLRRPPSQAKNDNEDAEEQYCN